MGLWVKVMKASVNLGILVGGMIHINGRCKIKVNTKYVFVYKIR